MTRAARIAFPWLTVVAILVVALSLRAPIVAPSAILLDIQRDLGVSAAAAGLLTTAPVLMFAVLTPVAAVVIRRAGAEVAVLAALFVVLAGTVARSAPGFGGLLVGTVVIGAGITIGNVVIPVIIRRDVPGRNVQTVTAAYVAVMNAGSLLTVLVMVPLSEAVGWPVALLSWAAVTATGAALWILHMRRDRHAGTRWAERDAGEAAAHSAGAVRSDGLVAVTGPMPVPGALRRGRPVWRMPVAWLLMGAFGCQTAAFYALTTWLPAIAQDERGLDPAAAAALASLFQGVAVIGAFLVPAMARIFPPAVPAFVISGCWLATGFGMVWLPAALPLWIATGAIAHAGGFVVIFTLLVRTADSDGEAAGMSALVQGGGYTIAAIAPPLVGAIHEATGGWMWPLAAIAVVTTGYAVFILVAQARDRDG